MLDRVAQIRRGCRVIDDKRNARTIGNTSKCFQVCYVAARVSDALTEDRAGVVIDGRLNSRFIIKINESRRPAEAFDGLRELRNSSTVKTTMKPDPKETRPTGRLTQRSTENQTNRRGWAYCSRARQLLGELLNLEIR